MPHRILLAALTICFLTASALAADIPASPYAGEQTRAIKALSPEDIAALRNGEGMGMAKAAELNGYPGPAHVLALAAQLGLTENQLQRVTAIFEGMSAAAKPLGSEVIAREQTAQYGSAFHSLLSPTRVELGIAAPLQPAFLVVVGLAMSNVV